MLAAFFSFDGKVMFLLHNSFRYFITLGARVLFASLKIFHFCHVVVSAYFPRRTLWHSLLLPRRYVREFFNNYTILDFFALHL